jgi:hypothetical protein
MFYARWATVNKEVVSTQEIFDKISSGVPTTPITLPAESLIQSTKGMLETLKLPDFVP